MNARISSEARVWGLNAALSCGAVAMLAATDTMSASPYSTQIYLPFPVLLVAFFLTEVFVVHVQFRRDSETFSLNEIPLVVGLFFASPVTVVAAQAAGAFAALILRKGQRPVKLAFNVAHLTLDTVVAVGLFRVIAQSSGGLLSGREFVAAMVATLGAIVFGVAAVITAISLVEGKPATSTLPRVLGFGVAGTVVTTCLGLVLVTSMRTGSPAAWLLVAPATALVFAYRAYTWQVRQRLTLQEMNDATREIQESGDIEPALMALLTRAREMFKADIAELVLLPTTEQPALRTTLGPGDMTETLQPILMDPQEGVWARVASEGQGVLLSRPIRNDRLRSYFDEHGIRDAIVAPLRGNGVISGVFTVANRLGDVTTFTKSDLELLEVLAHHASASLQNARLMTELQESLVRLTELNRMKDDFVATVSHELRTPLTAIQGSVKTILRMASDLEASPKELLHVIDRQGERLKLLIEDLLLASKLESHTTLPTPKPVAVGELLDEVLEGLIGRMGTRLLTCDISPEVGAAYTDRETVHRILSNLIDNAVKYSPEGAGIAVRVHPDGDMVVFEVEDHGQGLAPEQHEAIFDRFYQVDQSLTRRVGGAGLGLYICRRLAERIGARVWLERSVPGEGSVFCLSVARAAARPSTARSAS